MGECFLFAFFRSAPGTGYRLLMTCVWRRPSVGDALYQNHARTWELRCLSAVESGFSWQSVQVCFEAVKTFGNTCEALQKVNETSVR